ncbi:hypothetical protein QTP88_017205 [Uroleucon formosanum]
MLANDTCDSSEALTTSKSSKDDLTKSPHTDLVDDPPAPPLYIKNIANFSAFNHILTSIADPNGFTCKSSASHLIFSTFSPRVSRPYRVAIRGLHPSTLIINISTTLDELGHQWLSKNPTKRATAFLSVIVVNLLAILKTIATTPPAALNVVRNTLHTSAPRTGKVQPNVPFVPVTTPLTSGVVLLSRMSQKKKTFKSTYNQSSEATTSL